MLQAKAKRGYKNRNEKKACSFSRLSKLGNRKKPGNKKYFRLPSLSFAVFLVSVFLFSLSAFVLPGVSAGNAGIANTAGNSSYFGKSDKLLIYFFWGDGCPHCAKEKPFLEELQKSYPQLEIKSYETWHNKSNAEFFQELSNACGSKVVGVPTLFIGDDVIIGFDEKSTPGKIKSKIEHCLAYGCQDPLEKLSCNNQSHEHIKALHNNSIDIPFIGNLKADKISLPLFTFIIALLDGFNPCAMWVLCFLLTLLIYARSRKKIVIIGLVFVFTSAAIYFLFMSAWLNFFLLVGYVDFMRIIIALVAVIAGLINIKDFFWFKKGVSLTIPDKYKPKLFSKMRGLVKERSMAAVIFGTIVLACFANLIELLCTAGFPAIYTRVLTMQNFSAFGYYSYLVLYNLIYVIPLAAIVLVFAYTMGAHKFTEKHGKLLKLAGGLLMLVLGLILLFRPELLSFG